MVAGTVAPMRKGPLKSVKLTVIGGNLVIVLFVCCHSSETAWIMVALILITTALRCHQTMHRVGHRKELSDKLSTENNVCTHESFESTQPTPAWPSKHKLLPLDQHIHLPHRALSTQLPSYIPDPLQWLQHPSQFHTNEMCRHKALRGVPGTPTARQECGSSSPTQGVIGDTSSSVPS